MARLLEIDLRGFKEVRHALRVRTLNEMKAALRGGVNKAALVLKQQAKTTAPTLGSTQVSPGGPRPSK